MAHEEGDLTGSLYEYVQSQRLQASEAERLVDETIRRELAAKEQRRIRYEDLPDSVRGLFVRFSVIELLEEVKTRFWGGGFMSVVWIDGDVCIRLENHSRTVLYEQEYVSYTTYDYSFSPVNPSARSGGGWVKTGRLIPADLARVMIARSTKLQPIDSSSNYALHCSYFQEFGPVSDFTYRYGKPGGRTPFVIDRRIEAYQPPDALKKIIGGNLLGESGELR